MHPGNGTWWRSAVFDDSGDVVLGGDEDGVIWRWPWRAGAAEPVGQNGGQVDVVRRGRAGRNEVISTSWDGTLRMWDTRDGTLLRELAFPAAPVSAALSPDGSTLVVPTRAEELVFLDHDTWEELARVRAARRTTPVDNARWTWGQVSTIDFAPDSERVFVGCRDGNVTVWNTRTGERLWEHSELTGLARRLAVSPDGARLAVAFRDRIVGLWDARTYELVDVLRGHDDDVRHVAFTPDSATLVTASWDRTLAFWNARDGRPRGVLLGHADSIYACTILPDGATMLTHSEDATIRSWPIALARREILYGHQYPVWAIEFVGEELVTTDLEHGAKVWDLELGVPRLDDLVHVTAAPGTGEFPRQTKLQGLAVDRARDRFATGSGNGTMLLRSLSTGEPLGELAGHAGLITALAFTQDGGRLLSSSWDGSVRIWDLESGEERARILHDDQVLAMQLFAGDSRLATASRDGHVRVWDLAHGGLVWSARVADGASLYGLAVDPTEELVAAGGDDRIIEVFRTASGRRTRALRGHAGSVSTLAWLPDGSRLISGSEDRTVRLWHMDAGENVATLRGHDRQVRALAVSADGRLIASGGEDWDVRLWEIAPRGVR